MPVGSGPARALRVMALPNPRAGGSDRNPCLASYRTAGCACASLWLWDGSVSVRLSDWRPEMRSPLIAAYFLAIGIYAPAASLCQSLPPTAPKAQTVPQSRQPRTELDWHGTRPGNARRIADSAVVREGAASHQHSGVPAMDTKPRQPGDQQSGKPQMPGPVGLLLALALVDVGGAPPHETAHAK